MNIKSNGICIEEKIITNLSKKTNLFVYFQFIYELCELILEFDIKVSPRSICYKVLKKANHNLDFYEIGKTNPKLEAKCICILMILKNLDLNNKKYIVNYSFYSEISFREYILLMKLKEKGENLTFDENAYPSTECISFIDGDMHIIPQYSSKEKEALLKEWKWIIDSNTKFLVALKNNILNLEKTVIDSDKLNQLNLLILENMA